MPDSPSHDPRLDDHHLIWHNKPVLRELYSDFYRRISDACHDGSTLEIGGGSGNFKEFAPHVVSTDVLFAPWLDSVCDAQSLPFKDTAFDNVVMMDVFHHLERPTVFLREALRVLKPGGRLVMLEPLITPVSHYCYHYFHPEPVVMKADPFHEPETNPERTPYDANQAVPTLMFLRQRERFMEKFPGFNLYAVRRCGLFAAPLSGGFRKWSLIPAWAVPIINRIEKILTPVLGPLAAFRMLVILEHRPETHEPMNPPLVSLN
ncbi:MAG: class I SAM-dependent methyltransferase [Alphaproteobacteria bacterium]|nr:class I SAM-dependent methyltransferase [Alphaproteobacteria bacterium]MDP7191428.1 class I SAM-dependent methyltransferase [Alphaproteobacteria bacterium]